MTIPAKNLVPQPAVDRSTYDWPVRPGMPWERIEPAPTDDVAPLDEMITEDETPVDNIPSEKQQRLLLDALYNSSGLGDDVPFLAAANVGVFASPASSPLVPDIFLSLNVRVAEDWWAKHNRTYLMSLMGKPPEVVIEIVSNTKDNETTSKMHAYHNLRVLYYVVYDPQRLLSEDVVRFYLWTTTGYDQVEHIWMEEVGLGLRLWRGTFEGREDEWLRWCDRKGRIVLTGSERTAQERQEKEAALAREAQANQRAEHERQRAEHEHQRAEQERREKEATLAELEEAHRSMAALRTRLRDMGLDPDAW